MLDAALKRSSVGPLLALVFGGWKREKGLELFIRSRTVNLSVSRHRSRLVSDGARGSGSGAGTAVLFLVIQIDCK